MAHMKMRRRTQPPRCALLVLVLGLAACKKNEIDVAPIAAEAETLKSHEADLLTRRGALQRERKQLADARAALSDKRKGARDPAWHAAVGEREHQLTPRENQPQAQESPINRKL